MSEDRSLIERSDDVARAEQAMLDQAEQVAKAVGAPFIFGVRHAGSTRLFASCNDVEADGSTMQDCLDGVVSQLVRAAQSDRTRAQRDLDRADTIADLGRPTP